MNNSHKLTPSNKASKPKRSTQGLSAAGTIFSRARDQIVTATRQRYTGPSGLANIARDMNRLRAVLNTENKHLDSLFGTQGATPAAPVIVNVTSPAEGDDSNQRQGRSIKIDRIDMLLQLQYGAGSAGVFQDQTFRWFLVIWKKTPATGGSTPFPISNFLNQDVNANYSPLSFPNTDLAENFTILAQGEERLTLSYLSTASTRIVDVSVPVSIHQTFAGSTAASVCDNAIFFVGTLLQVSAVGGQNTFTPQIRMWYVDN